MQESKQVIAETTNLTKSFDTKVLDGVNFKAYEHQVTTILGSSGSGKSTLLRCLNLLEIPDDGDLCIYGKSIDFHYKKNQRILTHPKQIARMRSTMPMVFQHFNLWSHLNVLENITHSPIKVLKQCRADAIETAMHFLQKVGLADKADNFPAQLSGGQKQRVAIARALAMQPKLILMDEPTSALDPEMVNEVLLVMKELADEQCSMILVTHEINFAKNVSHNVVFLEQGKIIEKGSTEILENPQTQGLQNFLQYM